jgi:glutamate synthase (ferredoxin)
MTGGVVVALGNVARNVGAGMTGGIGYFYDPENEFEEKLNNKIVKILRWVRRMALGKGGHVLRTP